MGIERLNRAAIAAGYALAPHDDPAPESHRTAETAKPEPMQRIPAPPVKPRPATRTSAATVLAALSAPIAWLSHARSTA